jgi:acyl carrier protein
MSPNLIELVGGVLGVASDQLNADTGPKNLPKWDSLAHVTIVAAIEQTYKVEFTMPEILSVKVLADFDGLLRSRGITS